MKCLNIFIMSSKLMDLVLNHLASPMLTKEGSLAARSEVAQGSLVRRA